MSALALMLALLAGGQAATVRGRVLEAGTGQPVPGAGVSLASAGFTRFAFTDSSGVYRFGDVPAGSYRLDVTHPGFDPASVQFVVSGELGLQLEVPVTLRPVPSPPISVLVRQGARADAAGDGDAAEPRFETPSATERWLSAGPQSASGLSEMAAASAAAHPPDRQGREGAHVLYIWGSSGEGGRVLLDGAALAAPLHLGGVLSPIDPQLVEIAEPRSGGASPRFDGGTTQVMEFITRPARADRFRAWIEVDPLAGRAGVEAPVGGRGAVLAGVRRVNAGLIGRVTGRPFGYGYADALVRTDWPLAAGGLSATLFATDESVTIPRDFGQDRAAWANLAASVRWNREAAASGTGIGLSWGRASAELPLLTAPAAHGASDLDRMALDVSHAWRHASWQSAVGIEAERLGFARQEIVGSGGTACTETGACYDDAVGVVSPWAELVLQPRARLRLAGGARLAYNTRLDRVDALPRLSVTALLGNAMAVTASAGRYSRATLLASGGAPVLVDSGAAGPLRAAVARATHVELSLAQRSPGMAAGVTLFLRRHHAMPGWAGHTTPGLDAWWAHSGPASAVTVAWSFARLGPDAGSTRDRNMLAATWSRSAGPVRVRLSSAWARGLPYVSFVLDDPETRVEAVFDPSADTAGPGSAARPPDDYVRLDASISTAWVLDLRGRPTTLTPYLKVLNALARRDALFWFQDAGDAAGVRPLARMPLVPALGLRWVF